VRLDLRIYYEVQVGVVEQLCVPVVEHHLEVVLEGLVPPADVRPSLHQQALPVTLAGRFLDRLRLLRFWVAIEIAFVKQAGKVVMRPEA
jgi:hypothetical protein